MAETMDVELVSLNLAIEWVVRELRGERVNVLNFVREQWPLITGMMNGEDMERLAQASFVQRVNVYLRNPTIRPDLTKQDEHVDYPGMSPEPFVEQRPTTRLSGLIVRQPESAPPVKLQITIRYQMLEKTTLRVPSGDRKSLMDFHCSELDWFAGKIEGIEHGCGKVKTWIRQTSARMKKLNKYRIRDLADGEKSRLERELRNLKTKGFLVENRLE